MSEVITTLTILFSFLIDEITAIAEFFTTTTLGMLVLGIALFPVAFNVVFSVINKVRGR